MHYTFCRYYNFNLLRVQFFSGFLLIGIYFSRLGYIAYLKNPFSLAAAAAAAPRSLQAYDNYGGARRAAAAAAAAAVAAAATTTATHNTTPTVLTTTTGCIPQPQTVGSKTTACRIARDHIHMVFAMRAGQLPCA